MGSGTYGVLHDKLRKLMFGVLKPGEKRLTLDEAAARILRDYEAQGPAPLTQGPEGPQQPVPPLQDQLQGSLNQLLPLIQDKAQRMNQSYTHTLTPEQMEQRYLHSQRCRKVMMKLIKESVQRDIVFQETAKQLFGDNPFDQKVKEGQTPPKLGQRRWMEQLMRLENTDEARYHNEEVISLVMLGEYTSKAAAKSSGLDPEEGRRKFRAARYKHYLDDLKLTEEEANRRADDDLSKSARRLAELTLRLMNEHCCTPEEADQARDAILTGAAENNGPDGLERAYRTIMNPGNTVAWNVKNEFKDLNEFGAGYTAADYQQVFRPYEMASDSAQSAVAEFVANPYYAVLDGAKLANALVTGLSRNPKEREGPLVDFGGNVNIGLTASREDIKLRTLARFGFEPGDDRALNNQPDHISVCSNGERSVIFVGEPMSLEGGLRAPLNVDNPGQLINNNFDQWVSKLQAGSVKKDQFLRSSAEYRAMKRALNDVSRVRIPDNGDPARLDELEQKLTVLKTATDAYIARKDRQFQGRGVREGKNLYEKTRYQAAKDIDTFVNQMTLRIGYIRQHQTTVAQVLEQEQYAAEEQAERNLQNDMPQNNGQQNNVAQNNGQQNAPAVDELKNEEPKKEEPKEEEPKEEEPAQQENKAENPNRINESEPKQGPELEPFDEKDALLVSVYMKEAISQAYKENLTHWSTSGEYYAPGRFGVSNAYLDRRIEMGLEAYHRRDNVKAAASEVLSVSIVKYMMNHSEYGQVLEFALESGQYTGLGDLTVGMSRPFKERIDAVNWDDPKEGNTYLTDESLLIKPLGDQFLLAAEGVLAKEAPKVTAECAKHYYNMPDRGMGVQLQKSEAALREGDTAKAAELGTDALALQTVCGLVRGTAGMAGNPFTLQRMVHRSEYFKAEIAKIDFSKPGALREALEAKTGSRIAGTLLEMQKQKDEPVGNNRPNDKHPVKNEQKRQQKGLG